MDEVWHLHILYTVNSLGKSIATEDIRQKTTPPLPTRGGPEEKEKHVNWLQDTIKNYRLIFEEEPPPDIWETAIPDISLSPPPRKKNNRLGVIIILLTIIVLVLVWQSHNFMLIPFFTICAVGFIINASSPKKGRTQIQEQGGCSSSGGGQQLRK